MLISESDLLPFYSELMRDNEWKDLLYGSDITSARLAYRAECYCVECKGLYPRTAEFWKVDSLMPYRLGTGICIRCIKALRGG